LNDNKKTSDDEIKDEIEDSTINVKETAPELEDPGRND